MRRKTRKKGFLLDTDVLINLLKHAPGYRPLSHRQSPALHYASISKKELFGKRGLTGAEARAIAALLKKLRQVNLDARILECFDTLLRNYRFRGLLKADALIAATAWAKGLILVTGNVQDFHSIEEIAVIPPADFFKSLGCDQLA